MTVTAAAIAAAEEAVAAARLALAPFHAGSARADILARLRELHTSAVRARSYAEADAGRLYARSHALTEALNRAGAPTPDTFDAYRAEAEVLRCADERRAFARDLAAIELAVLEIIANHRDADR